MTPRRTDAERRGLAAGNDIGRSAAVTGDNNSAVNISFEQDAQFVNDRQRIEWQIRQITALRNALIGDEEYGVGGLIDSVRTQRIWLIILTAAVIMIALLLLYQQVQIHRVLERLAALAAIR